MFEDEVLLLCNYGGDLVYKDRKYDYEGGKTRCFSIHQSVKLSELLFEVNKICKPADIGTIKYKFPGLNSRLISLEDENDVSNMLKASRRSSTPVELYAFAAEISSSAHDAACSRPELDNGTIQITESTSPKGADACRIGENRNLSSLLHERSFSNAQDKVLAEDQVVESRDCNYTQKIDYAIYEGQEFQDMNALDMALRDHAIHSNFQYQTIRKDHRLFAAKCLIKGCTWCIRACKVYNRPTFMVKRLNAIHCHSCEDTVLAEHQQIGQANHKQTSQKWIANFIRKRLHKHLHSRPNDIVADISDQYGIEVNYHKARRGKELALRTVCFGSSINDLITFCQDIERSNPGSVVTLWLPSESSLGVFIAYWAAIYGFRRGCRPIIGLCSEEIKGDYPCFWLYALGVDAMDGRYLVAYAMVDSTSQETWAWFVTWLARALDGVPKITIVTMVEEVSWETIACNFPNAYHQYNRIVLLNRFYWKFPNDGIKDLFWSAITTKNPGDVEIYLSKIYNISPEARTWIDAISPSPKHWALSHHEGPGGYAGDAHGCSGDFSDGITKVCGACIFAFEMHMAYFCSWEFDEIEMRLPYALKLKAFHTKVVSVFGKAASRTKDVPVGSLSCDGKSPCEYHNNTKYREAYSELIQPITVQNDAGSKRSSLGSSHTNPKSKSRPNNKRLRSAPIQGGRRGM